MSHPLLQSATEYAFSYLDNLASRRVAPTAEDIAALSALGGPLNDEPNDPAEVLRLLHTVGSPATVTSAGGRYFGFVIGGALPVTVAANWLAGAWDQCAGLYVLSPTAAELENVASGWVLDILGLPPGAGVGFVTGATMANVSGLAAARHALLQRLGWNVEAQGLFGAPPLKIVVGDEVHVSVESALSLVGFGRERVIRVPVDTQGRMRPDALPPLDETTILCINAGNVNTGACDPAAALCEQAHAAGAWVHVDGAFGLWLAASPKYAHLTDGVGLADSWSLDAHKWLNVPYDSGLVICRDRQHLLSAMTVSAGYLVHSEQRDCTQFTPEMSRRARGVEVWAALRTLGRAGVADLIERTCGFAARFAEGLRAAGYDILNDVVSNQVLVSFGDAETTRRVIAAVQADGTCWCGGTLWQGHTAMRISVSSWATTAEDVERSLEAIIRCAQSATG